MRRVLAVALIVWASDLLTKSIALHSLEGRAPKHLIGNFLQLTFTQNSGAAFSFISDGSILLGCFAILAIFFIAFWAPRLTSRGWAYVLGLVLGGTVGNLSDRIFRSNSGVLKGQVIDWIQLPAWPVFNVADSAIVIAAGIAVFLSFRNVLPISHVPRDSEGKGSPDA